MHSTEQAKKTDSVQTEVFFHNIVFNWIILHESLEFVFRSTLNEKKSLQIEKIGPRESFTFQKKIIHENLE